MRKAIITAPLSSSVCGIKKKKFQGQPGHNVCVCMGEYGVCLKSEYVCCMSNMVYAEASVSVVTYEVELGDLCG